MYKFSLLADERVAVKEGVEATDKLLRQLAHVPIFTRESIGHPTFLSIAEQAV